MQATKIIAAKCAVYVSRTAKGRYGEIRVMEVRLDDDGNEIPRKWNTTKDPSVVRVLDTTPKYHWGSGSPNTQLEIEYAKIVDRIASGYYEAVFYDPRTPYHPGYFLAYRGLIGNVGGAE